MNYVTYVFTFRGGVAGREDEILSIIAMEGRNGQAIQGDYQSFGYRFRYESKADKDAADRDIEAIKIALQAARFQLGNCWLG